MKPIELKPCPFCGSTNVDFEFSGSCGFVECKDCGCVGPSPEAARDPECDISAALHAWNERK